MAPTVRIPPGKRHASSMQEEDGGRSKKRRLAPPGLSSPSTPRALSVIHSAISNVFRLGSGRSPLKHGLLSVDNPYEVPESDEESEAPAPPQKPSGRLGAERTPQSKSAGRRRVHRVDELAESGDELSIAPSPSRSSIVDASRRNDPDGSKAKPRKGGDTTPRQENGPRSTGKVSRAPMGPSSPSMAQSSRKENIPPDQADELASDTVMEDSPYRGRDGSSRRSRKPSYKKLQEQLANSIAISTSKSSSGGKKLARAEPGGPKARATPSTRTEVFFEDLPGKDVREGQKPKAPSPVRVDEEEEEEDDEEEDDVCQVCSKPDSVAPNEIIYCDGCDMAVHQKCYGIATVPEGDWFCRDCAQVQSSMQTTSRVGAPREKTSAVVHAEEVPDIANFEHHLRTMQSVLLARCTGRRRIRLRGQDEAHEKVSQLVRQTVLAGEGNSMLVIGARGSGKTTLVEGVISELSDDSRDAFHVVRLNGFIHTDDKLALKEIWRQLGREMEVDDELVQKTNNYADTLQSLLAVLSHPSELGGAGDGVTSKSVVFIIDEFDLFATHARQTLLYNLFDIAQARKAPIAVLGLTTRIDVVESLEKRVKSRFSHRYVHLALPKSLPAYWDVCRQGLMVDEEDMASEGIDTKVEGHAKFSKYWSHKIKALYEDPQLKAHLEFHFYSTKSVPAFLVSCLGVLPYLSPSSPTLAFPSPPDGTRALAPPDSKLALLDSLADLELSLLIAAARLDIVAHTDTVNFAMAYDEYAALVGRQRLQSASAGLLALGGGNRIWGRGVAATAWERLGGLGLLIPAAGPGSGAGASASASAASLESRMWKLDVALEEIAGAVKLSAVLGKWCREI